MSLDQSDKLSSKPAVPAASPTEPAVADAHRPRPQVWPAPTGESLDTFATPSETTATEEPVLTGPEPAVFGGLNPNDADSEELNEPLGTPLEEPLRGDELIPEAPDIEWSRVIRSTWFLLTGMITMLIGGTFAIWLMVPTETYVQTTIVFQRYGGLSPDDAIAFQQSIKTFVRDKDVRARATEILQERSIGVRPDWVQYNNVIFDRTNGMTWLDSGELRLRVVDSKGPGDDRVRLAALVEAFFELHMKQRTRKLEELKLDLAAIQSDLLKQKQEEAELKSQVDALLPDAERYSEAKQAMEALAEYVKQADESNPLRLVARQRLDQLTQEVASLREIADGRDGKRDEHRLKQEQIRETEETIVELEGSIEGFVFAEAPGAKAIETYDTRGLRQTIMRGMWIGVILLFAGIMAALYIIDQRAAEAHRRERRELLKTRKAATART